MPFYCIPVHQPCTVTIFMHFFIVLSVWKSFFTLSSLFSIFCPWSSLVFHCVSYCWFLSMFLYCPAISVELCPITPTLLQRPPGVSYLHFIDLLAKPFCYCKYLLTIICASDSTFSCCESTVHFIDLSLSKDPFSFSITFPFCESTVFPLSILFSLPLTFIFTWVSAALPVPRQVLILTIIVLSMS